MHARNHNHYTKQGNFDPWLVWNSPNNMLNNVSSQYIGSHISFFLPRTVNMNRKWKYIFAYLLIIEIWLVYFNTHLNATVVLRLSSKFDKEIDIKPLIQNNNFNTFLFCTDHLAETTYIVVAFFAW